MAFDAKDMEPERREQNSATYCPEDDKLRLYCGRVERATYDELRRLGFVSTPKQNCDFAAVWTVSREDTCLRLVADEDDIGAEDQGPEERAADRAERFAGYREKRIEEAGGLADRYESGPSAYGGQNAARVERLAARRDRIGGRAVTQWGKAEYWQQRTAGVIANALHRSSARVRRGRILELEAELRKAEKARDEARAKRARWLKVAELEGADEPVSVLDAEANEMRLASTKAAVECSRISNEFYHHGDMMDSRGREKTLLHFMYYDREPMTAKELAQTVLNNSRDVDDPTSYSARYVEHLRLRLEYENAMLANEGGMAGEVEMIPGGWIRGGRTHSVIHDAPSGWRQVLKVNKSPKTGRVTSVEVWGTSSGYTRESDYKEFKTVPARVRIDVTRLGEGCYRAPTEEELREFEAKTKAEKAEAKATAKKAPSLINPTIEDAERLQELWNRLAEAKHAKAVREHRTYGEFRRSVVRKMTQEAYSEASKGAYARLETESLCEDGTLPRKWDDNKPAKNAPTVCKIRKGGPNGDGGSYWSGGAHSLVVLTDKPGKPLPLDWDAIEAAVEAQVAELAAAPLVLA